MLSVMQLMMVVRACLFGVAAALTLTSMLVVFMWNQSKWQQPEFEVCGFVPQEEQQGQGWQEGEGKDGGCDWHQPERS